MAKNAVKVIPITSDEDFSSQTTSLPASALLVLYFHAPWAAPCAQMSQVLDALASIYEASEPATIKFLSINAEELPDISEEHDVTAVPFIVLQKDKQTVETVSGSDAATLRAAVEKHAGPGGATTAAGAAAAGQSTTIPPAQKVTRPETQPVASTASVHTAAPTNGAKDLSSYAPNENTTTSSKTAPPVANGELSPDINTRLTELTNAAPVMLFMKGTPSAPQCGFSRQLVSILRENAVRYGFFNILADEEVRQGLKLFADWPTFPQLWMGGELVGGLDIVRDELESNPDFFGEYVAAPAQKNQADPAASPEQARPTAAA